LISRDNFQGVETAKKQIIKYVSEHGSARWTDFEKLGIPKATISRALRSLLREGILAKEERGVYVLKISSYKALIQSEYAPRICDLIECDDVESLANDLMKIVSDRIIYIDEAHNYFINEYLKSVETFSQIRLDPIIKEVFKVFYEDKGVFTIVMLELSKVFEGLLVMEKCDDIVLGLKEDVVNKLKESIAVVKKIYTEIFGLKEEIINVLKDVREVLRKHGYKGIIKLKILAFPLELNINDVVISSLSFFTHYLGSYAESVVFLYKISLRYQEEGCRPLSSKEKEELLRLISGQKP